MDAGNRIEESERALRDLARRRGTVAATLSLAVVVVYFGFLLLVAFAKPFMGTLLVPGLSIGIVLGALVIVAAWLLTLVYVRWANTRFDAAVRRLRAGDGR